MESHRPTISKNICCIRTTIIRKFRKCVVQPITASHACYSRKMNTKCARLDAPGKTELKRPPARLSLREQNFHGQPVRGPASPMCGQWGRHAVLQVTRALIYRLLCPLIPTSARLKNKQSTHDCCTRCAACVIFLHPLAPNACM